MIFMKSKWVMIRLSLFFLFFLVNSSSFFFHWKRPTVDKNYDKKMNEWGLRWRPNFLLRAGFMNQESSISGAWTCVNGSSWFIEDPMPFELASWVILIIIINIIQWWSFILHPSNGAYVYNQPTPSSSSWLAGWMMMMQSFLSLFGVGMWMCLDGAWFSAHTQVNFFLW